MTLNTNPPIILDGGMGRELERNGAPFKQPQWSALALMEAPDAVLATHQSFIKAGATVITTNAYAIVPFHIGEQCFEQRGAELAALAANLAKAAVKDTDARVAGCLPPVLGSYQAHLFEPIAATKLLRVLIENQVNAVDFWLAETISSIAEAALIKELTATSAKECWIALTVNDEPTDTPRLRSQESVFAAVTKIDGDQVTAILFNCSKAEVMGDAIKEAKRALHLLGLEPHVQIGVYANSFAPNDDDEKANSSVTQLRADLTPEKYAKFAQLWLDQGATIIGGCCGVSPEHIKYLADQYTKA